MLIRNLLATLMLIGIMTAFGCGGNPTSPASDADVEAFFAGVSPTLTGIVGDYTFTGKDGSLSSGKLVADENGTITLVPDRGTSVFSNAWFTIDVDYLNPRGYTGTGLPYYYVGDNFTYVINIDYLRGLTLNAWPLLYSKLTAEQRYYPGGALLPGGSVEVWDPFLIDPYQSLQVYDDFTIVSGTVTGNDATWCSVELEFLFGWFEFNLAYGICGMWDP